MQCRSYKFCTVPRYVTSISLPIDAHDTLKISQTIKQVDYVHNGRNGQNALQVHNPLFVVADRDLDSQFHPVNTPQHAKLDSLDLSQDHVDLIMT